MRSFAIEEPGSPVPALYATLDLINRDEHGEEFLKVTQAFAERLANAGREENAEEVQHHQDHHHQLSRLSFTTLKGAFCRPLVNPSIIFTLVLDLSCNIHCYISYIHLILICIFCTNLEREGGRK